MPTILINKTVTLRHRKDADMKSEVWIEVRMPEPVLGITRRGKDRLFPRSFKARDTLDLDFLPPD